MQTFTATEQLQCIDAIQQELIELSIMVAIISNGDDRMHAVLTGPGSTHHKLTKLLARLRTPDIIDLEETIMEAYEEATWD